MNTDKVNALWVKASDDAEGMRLGYTMQHHYFAALIQQQMEAENVCICGYTYAQHTYDKNCDSHGVCPNRQGVFRNERQHELIQKLDAENAELRRDAERYRWQMENPAIAFHYYKVRGFTTEYSAEIDRARSCK